MQDKLIFLRDALSNTFPERRNVIDGALCAILANEHVLLLGPPGTAKSALVRALAQAFGGNYFERLLTKFSTLCPAEHKVLWTKPLRGSSPSETYCC